MYRRKRNRDLAQTILSRRYVPLEDKVFVQILVGLTLLFFGIFEFTKHLEEELINENIPEIAQQIVHGVPQKSLEQLPIENFIQEAEHHSSLFRISRMAIPDSCDKSRPTCTIRQSDATLVLFFDIPTAKSFAIAVNMQKFTTQRSLLTTFPLSSGIAAALLITLVLRFSLRRQIFANLDIITKVVFARRIFVATGGIAQDSTGHDLDGRIHLFASIPFKVARFAETLGRLMNKLGLPSSQQNIVDPQKKNNTIRIVRQPDYPRIPLEEFANDELGQLALALEEDHARELRYEHLLADFLESIPFPAATISKDFRNIHINKRMRDTIGTPRETDDVSPTGLAELLERRLGLSEELSKRAIKILEQSAPRLDTQDGELLTESGPRTFPVSISGFNKLGKRVAIIAIHDDLRSNTDGLVQLLSTLASEQLNLLQTLAAELERGTPSDRPNLLGRVSVLEDQINLMLELTQTRRSTESDRIDFNIRSLLHGIVEQCTPSHKISLKISQNVPSYLFSNPTQLRHFLILVLHEWFSETREETEISVNHESEKDEICFSLSSPASKGHSEFSQMTPLFLKLGKIYGFSPLSRQEENHRTLEFKLYAKPSTQPPSFILLDTKEHLDKKSMLVIHQNETSPVQILDSIEQIKTKRTETLLLRDFVNTPYVKRQFDITLLLANTANWHTDPEVIQLARFLRNTELPSLLLSNTPRRGELAEARALGFDGYLRRPFSHKELVGALIVLCSPDARELLRKRGLITRHTIHELHQEAGTALVAEFEPDHYEAATAIAESLLHYSIKTFRTSSKNEFFEETMRQAFTYILYPSNLSIGMRRQIGINLHGRKAICYCSSSLKTKECNPPHLPHGHEFIRDPSNLEEVLRALRATTRTLDSETPKTTTPKKSA